VTLYGRIWLSSWLHLSLFIDFIRHGRPNIDIVPTMITEDLWVASALISASIPTLVRIGMKFTTTGVTVNTLRGGSKTKDSSMQRYKLKRVVNEGAEKVKMFMRPDRAFNLASIDAVARQANGTEGASLGGGSAAESQVGILRQIGFRVSSENQ
jgi:hypothetical protein